MLVPRTKKVQSGRDRISARDFNTRAEVLKAVARSMPINGFSDSSGVNVRRVGGGAEAGVNIKLVRIISASTGDGIYNCSTLSIDATEWVDTAGDSKFDDEVGDWAGGSYNVGNYTKRLGIRYRCILAHSNQQPPNATYWVVDQMEVLNLYENDPIASHYPALGLYDRLMCWEKSDDENNDRWIGIPLTPQIRIVYAAENAPATDCDTTSVTCNLELNNGVEAAVGELGYEIEVYGSCVGGTENWNGVVPRIFDTDKLTAQWVNGIWGFTTEFMPSQACACS